MVIQGHSRSSVSMSMKIHQGTTYSDNNFGLIYEHWKDITRGVYPPNNHGAVPPILTSSSSTFFRHPVPQPRRQFPISPPCILFLYQHSFARNFRLQFSVGVANPRFWGRGGRRESGMVPFERALVGFYRPSIVTFPLSLRVSEILPLFFSSMPLFP